MGTRPRIALLPWGDLLEDFLDSIGLSLEAFREEMSGGWLFGYVEALKRAGVDTVLVCVSARVDEPARWRHAPTGAPLIVLPAPRAYLRARGMLRDPQAWTTREAVGRRSLVGGAVHNTAPYLATPVRAVAAEIRRHRCGAILCQEYEYPRFDACVLLGRILRLPVFATFQGGAFQRVAPERALRPLAIRACSGLVIGSAAEAERVRGRYRVPEDKIVSVFNPLDADVWRAEDREAARERLGLARDALVVAWHGRVDLHVKGLDVLVEAWRRLSAGAEGERRRLLLVGTGRHAAELRTLVGSLSGVEWVDEYVLDRARMRGYLSAADVYVLPSRREGFPVAPVEAMACGLPVVAADAPGVREIYPTGELSGGVIVPREDPDALAGALDELLADASRRRELGRRSRRRVEEAFSLESVGRTLRDFFVKRGLATRP
jgi:glycosyltransferase involved in cell wall biosynthesis